MRSSLYRTGQGYKGQVYASDPAQPSARLKLMACRYSSSQRSASRNCCRWPATPWGCTSHKNSICSTSRRPKRYLMYWHLALIAAARRAFGRGLLRGYLTEEEALHTVRGRIRFDEQIRRRYGIPLAGRTALRRVHRGHPGQPAGEGGRGPAPSNDPALVGGAPGSGLDRRDPRERVVARVPEEARAGGPLSTG